MKWTCGGHAVDMRWITDIQGLELFLVDVGPLELLQTTTTFLLPHLIHRLHDAIDHLEGAVLALRTEAVVEKEVDNREL